MNKILAVYRGGLRQTHLLAQMQSGKSGIFLGLALAMLEAGLVDRVFILCGSNEVELYDQMKDNWRLLLDRYAENVTGAVLRRVEHAVKIFKSTGANGIDNMPRDFARTLVIWDEAHYAQDIGNKPAQYLQTAGVLVSGTEKSHSTWVDKDSYFLSVSATPFAAISCCKHKEFRDRITHTELVWHDPAPTYTGVGALKAHFRPSFTIKQNMAAFRDMLSTVKPRHYAMVRSRNLPLVAACCAELGIRFMEYTASTKHNLQKGLNCLRDQPDVTTVIGLKGMCRMGKVVPKRFIGLVFEEAQNTKTDTLLQSFVGRMCGHNSTEDPYPAEMPAIYVPAKFAKDESFNEVDRFLALMVDKKETIPKKAAHVAVEGTTQAERTGRYSIVPFFVPFRDEDEEDFGDAALAAEHVLQEGQRWHPTPADRTWYAEKIQAYLAANPLADACQMEHLLGRANVENIEFHNFECYNHVTDEDTGIEACERAGTAFEDQWKNNGRCIYVYRKPGTSDGVWVTAFTTVAEEATVMEQKNAMPKAELTTVYARDEIVPKTQVIKAENHPVSVVTSLEELCQFSAALMKAGIHTAYIHNSLRALAAVKALTQRSKTEGASRGGRYLPKAYNKEEFGLRITLKVTVTITVEATMTIL